MLRTRGLIDRALTRIRGLEKLANFSYHIDRIIYRKGWRHSKRLWWKQRKIIYFNRIVWKIIKLKT